MESAIPPVPVDRVVPQPRARDGTNKQGREKSGSGFALPHEAPADAKPEPTPAPDAAAHPPHEEGIGGRLDVTA